MIKILSSRKFEKPENYFKQVRVYQVEICEMLIIPIVAAKDKSSPVIEIVAQNSARYALLYPDTWKEIRAMVKEQFLKDIE